MCNVILYSPYNIHTLIFFSQSQNTSFTSSKQVPKTLFWAFIHPLKNDHCPCLDDIHLNNLTLHYLLPKQPPPPRYHLYPPVSDYTIWALHISCCLLRGSRQVTLVSACWGGWDPLLGHCTSKQNINICHYIHLHWQDTTPSHARRSWTLIYLLH